MICTGWALNSGETALSVFIVDQGTITNKHTQKQIADGFGVTPRSIRLEGSTAPAARFVVGCRKRVQFILHHNEVYQ